MLDSIRHILLRLRELRIQVELRMLRDPPFRSLCQDYGEAANALEHWNGSTLPEAPQRVAEYRALMLELEAEILGEIKRADGPPGAP